MTDIKSDTRIWICDKCRTYPCILELDRRFEPVTCPLGAGTGLPLSPEWIPKEERLANKMKKCKFAKVFRKKYHNQWICTYPESPGILSADECIDIEHHQKPNCPYYKEVNV